MDRADDNPLPAKTPPPLAAVHGPHAPVEPGVRPLPFPPWKTPSDPRRAVFVFALWLASFLGAEFIQAAALSGYGESLSQLPLWRGVLALAPWSAALLWTTFGGTFYGTALMLAAGFFPSPLLPTGAWYAGPLAMWVYGTLLNTFRFHTAVRTGGSAGLFLFANFCAAACVTLLGQRYGSQEMLLAWERQWIFLMLHSLLFTLPVLVLGGPTFERWKKRLFGKLPSASSGLRQQFLSFASGMVLVVAFSVAWTLTSDLDVSLALQDLLNEDDPALIGAHADILETVQKSSSYKRGFLIAALTGALCGGAALAFVYLRRYREALFAEAKHSTQVELRWRGQTSALTAVAEATDRNPDNEPLLQDVLQQCALLTGAAEAGAYLPDSENNTALALAQTLAPDGSAYLHSILLRSGTLAAQCMDSGLVVHQCGALNDTAQADLPARALQNGRWKSLVYVPIQGERRTLGVVLLLHDTYYIPDSYDLPILHLVGTLLGSALERNETQLKARQYAGDLSGLYRFSQQLLAENGDEGIFAAAAPAACQLLNASCAAVFAVRTTRGLSRIDCTAVHGPPARMAMLRELSFALNESGAIAEAIREKRSAVTGKRAENPPPLNLIPGWTESCAIAVPLPAITRDEQPRGALVVSFDIPRDLALEEIGLAEEIARQTAAALRRVNLLRTISQQANELRVLEQLGRTMSQRHEMRSTLKEIVANVPKLVPAAWATLFVLDGEASQVRVRATTMPHPEAQGMTIPLNETSIVVSALDSGLTLVSNDMNSDPRCNRERNKKFKARACVCVPLGSAGRRFGVLMVSDPEPASFGHNDVRLLEQVGQLASTAIERAQLYEESVARTDELILLNEVGHLLVENPLLETTLQRIASLLIRDMDVAGLAFLLKTENSDALTVRGFSGGDAGHLKTLRIDLSTNDLAVSAYHSHQASSVTAPESETLRFQTAPNAKAAAAIPLFQAEHAVGVLTAWRATAAPFKPREIQRLTHVARLAASAASRESLGRALRASEALLQEVVDGIEALIVSIDREGNIRSLNATAERLSGIARHEVLGKPLVRLVCSNARDQQRLFHYIAHAYETGRCAGKIEIDWSTKSGTGAGTARKIRWSASFLHGGDGKASGLVFLGLDITEQAGLETQLRQAQKMESVGTLAGGMAHDFNNLLGGIIGQSTLLRAINETDAELCDGLMKIEGAAQRGADLTAKLMAFARKSVLQPRSVDIGALINETAELLAGSIPRRIQVVRKVAPLLPPVWGDPTQLQQVLLNLCVNARDAMPEGGTLTIAASHIADAAFGEGAGGVLVEVTDSGTGMTEEVQQRLFEPFFTTKAPGKGTGLGLSVVFGIVHSHGGEIACYSHVGEGTRFSIRIPAMRRGTSGLYRSISSSSNATRPDQPLVSATPAPMAFNVTALRGTETVLVIDDDTIVRETVHSLLTALGYTVQAANGGTEALKQLDADPPFKPALILLDVVMPGLAGPALYKELRARLPDIPIVLISGYSQDQTIQEMLALGARELVQKPFTLETIAVALRRHLTPAATT